MAVAYPYRRFAQRSRPRLEQRQHICSRQVPTLHLVERHQRDTQRTGPPFQARQRQRVRLGYLDERKGDRMLECAIHRLVGQGEKRCNRLRRTDPAKRLGSRTTHRRLSIFEQTNQANDRLGVAV